MFRLCLLSLICASTLFAHKINLFAYDEEGILYLHGYFTKTSACKQCPIILVGKDEKELARVASNDEGKASLRLPAPSFDIIVDGGMGHQQRVHYTAQSHTKEEIKALPSDAPLDKILLGLAIIALLFGGIFWLKKRKILL
jgi:hypothetical protein